MDCGAQNPELYARLFLGHLRSIGNGDISKKGDEVTSRAIRHLSDEYLPIADAA
jgi:hypothetical protein